MSPRLPHRIPAIDTLVSPILSSNGLFVRRFYREPLACIADARMIQDLGKELSMSTAAIAAEPVSRSIPPHQSGAAAQGDAIRPFLFTASEEALADLRRRIAATRWPEKETVSDETQGVQLATIQKLARYWATDYDWRKVEARLNALPQFITEVDLLDIHFIHVRSKHENALPLIVTHGWPGSIIEQLKIIEPLTNPTAHGGSATDAFHVVIPSMPGYGFSGKPTTTGWGPERIARAWATLMERLGYPRYAAQGGDWGALIVDTMGVQAPRGLVGIHTNLARGIPPEINAAPSPARRRPPASTKRKRRPSTASPSSTSTAWATPWRWGTGRRRCTGSRILRSAWPRGSSITTSGPTSRSPASSTASPRA